MPETASRHDPLTSFNFIVDFPGVRAGFAEISGLTGENTVIEYREGDRPIHATKLPGQTKWGQIVLKGGFSPNKKDLWEWRKSVMEGHTKRLSGTITLLDESQQPAMVWHIFEAWPSKWGGPAFNAKNNDVAIEELELAHEGLLLE